MDPDPENPLLVARILTLLLIKDSKETSKSIFNNISRVRVVSI
jgi:hypothetical protein